ncbi:MAG: hypothetical protein K2V38_12655, partial [Gemmataceae bacterium]|nr:hypothetical protein [Gemmataceae bacterium]
MTDKPTPAKKRPDYIAYIPQPSRATGHLPRLIRAGCAFTYRNGSIGVLFDLTPLAGQIVLVGIDEEVPAEVRTAPPLAAPQFEVNHVRDTGGDSFWQVVGDAYREDGAISLF